MRPALSLERELNCSFLSAIAVVHCFAIAIVLPLLFVKLKPQELKPVYLCGEQAGDVDTDEWYAELIMYPNWKLVVITLRVRSEEALNTWVYVVAIALLTLMFGIVVGVIL